jgi:membrane glycosyltransferase
MSMTDATTPSAPPAGRLPLAPPIRRSSMVPEPWITSPLARAWHALGRKGRARRAAARDPVPPDARGNWQRAGTLRRAALLVLIAAQTAVATAFMLRTLPYHGRHWLEVVVLAFFALLFAWVSLGFWTALAGFVQLLVGPGRYGVRASADMPIPAEARTAIVMPIANEDVPRVFAGLRATYESVARSGELEHFDFYVLSDSGDPDIATAELAAWRALVEAVGGAGRIFYRRRRRRVKRKSGNIDDFCRRWGAGYRYMVVLDADSVMSGQCLASLVRMMEANPGAGIIQTAPRASGRDTFYARVQQFATRVYGPLFTAGLHCWQLGESHYWGHNAIIRMAPFMRHCALAPLPGRGALSGEILSHDFVEAALMRRAGWAVWIAYDLPGSYEELPPNLLDELKRDRRWCQGNLMNFKLFFVRGLHPVHRTVFLTGMMSYMSAPLWFTFLMLSTALLAVQTLLPVAYFTQPHQLAPTWPQWHPERAVALFTATATLLFLPKLLAVARLWLQGDARRYGGALRLAASMLAEVGFSMLLAPVRMMFHTKFVNAALLGWSITWKSPPREDSQTTWAEAFGRHGLQTLIGLLWGASVWLLNRQLLAWMSPVIGALLLAIPVSVLSSRVSLGRRSRRARLFVIPEELRPPPELRATRRYTRLAAPTPGFAEAVAEPAVHALAVAAAPARHHATPAQERARQARLAAALRGLPALDARQRLALLDDPVALSRLHRALRAENGSRHRTMEVAQAG